MPPIEANLKHVVLCSVLSQHKTTEGIQTPARPKVVMDLTHRLAYGDVDNFWVDLLSLILYCIPIPCLRVYDNCGGERGLEGLIQTGRNRANDIKAFLIDDFNECNQFNWMYHASRETIQFGKDLARTFRDLIDQNLTEDLFELYNQNEKKLASQRGFDLVLKNIDNKVGLYFRSQGDSRPDELILTKDEFEKIVQLKKIEQPLTNPTLISLRNSLSLDARILFNPLFNIPKIRNVTARSPLVLGDTDGSTARMVLAGIQAGKIETDARGIELLAQIMNEEARTIREVNEEGDEYDLYGTESSRFERFQRSRGFQLQLEELADHLTYQKGDENRKLIFLGDVTHDRLSSNKDVDRQIRKELYDQGAIFIRGNHDVHKQVDRCHEELKKRWKPSPSMLSQWGFYAKDTACGLTWKIHEWSVFRNAYYDEQAKTLYTHHGLTYYEAQQGKLEYCTAFGDAKFDNTLTPTEIADWMNGLGEHDSDRLNRFRPTNKEMQYLAQNGDFTAVHGHDGSTDYSLPNLVVLNSTGKNGKRVVAAAYVGEYQKIGSGSPDYV